MSDLTREQIEERRRWIEATTVNPEYATVLCDMALRTLEAEERNRQLEAALREIRYRCVTRAANNNGQLIREVDRVLSATAPSDSEPAEGEGGQDVPQCHKCGDVKIHPSRPYQETEQGEHDPWKDLRDSGGIFPEFYEQGETAPTPDGGEGALEALDEIMPELDFGRGTHVQWRDYLQQHPDGEKRNPECGDADFHAKMVKVYDKRIAAIEKARRALREPRVPEAVRRLPNEWRSWGLTSADACADELDRALAQSEQGQSDASHTANIIALDHAADILDPDTPEAVRGAHNDHWKRVAARNLRDISDQIRRAAAPQPQAGESDE